MKEKLQEILKELSRWECEARQSQKLSRDENKQWYHLGTGSATAKAIGLIKRKFQSELSPPDPLVKFEVKKKA